MDETWRWAIGGGLAAVLAGVGWLVRVAYQIGATLTLINTRLDLQSDRLDDHARRIDGIESRLLLAEKDVARHSGQWSAQ